MATRTTTTRTALLTWAMALARPVTETEIKAKAKELRGRHFSETEFSEQLYPVWHVDTYQCDECSGTLCRPLFKKMGPLWTTFFEQTNPLCGRDPEEGWQPIYKVTQW